MAILFEDNFDSHADSCHTGGDVPSGWDSWYLQETAASATYDEVTHYAGEISSTGRGGAGKSLKIWRHQGYPATNAYAGGLGYTALDNGISHIFMRYYMKLPTSLNCTYSTPNGDYIKLWRWNTTGNEIYLNITGGPSARANGALTLFAAGGTYYDYVLIDAGDLASTIWDGDWHCLEFEMDLDNDILRFWLDGTLTYENESTNWSGNADADFDFIQHFSIGNISDNFAWQNSWQAAEFDDFVIADEYIGQETEQTSKRTLFRKTA